MAEPYPFEKMIRHYAGSLPFSDEAAQELLAQLEAHRQLPVEIAPSAARFALRVAAAIAPDFCSNPDIARKMTGLDNLTEQQTADAINATGLWAGEAGAQVVRRLIQAVERGINPDTAAAVLSIPRSELAFLNNILDLPARWEYQMTFKVAEAQEERTALRRYTATANAIGSLRPKHVRAWRRKAAALVETPD